MTIVTLGLGPVKETRFLSLGLCMPALQNLEKEPSRLSHGPIDQGPRNRVVLVGTLALGDPGLTR